MAASSENISASALAKQAELEYNARETLRKGRFYAIEAVANALWLGIFVTALSQFQAPLLVKLVLFVPVVMIPSQAFELFYLRRRINAALTLLGISRSDR
jgi:hypothetical protein